MIPSTPNSRARQHVVDLKRGVWRTAEARERCGRYWGKLPRCLGVIRKGTRYFDTQVRGNVCLGCATSDAVSHERRAA
jgi:hypothetical protein